MENVTRNRTSRIVIWFLFLSKNTIIKSIHSNYYNSNIRNSVNNLEHFVVIYLWKWENWIFIPHLTILCINRKYKKFKLNPIFVSAHSKINFLFCFWNSNYSPNGKKNIFMKNYYYSKNHIMNEMILLFFWIIQLT